MIDDAYIRSGLSGLAAIREERFQVLDAFRDKLCKRSEVCELPLTRGHVTWIDVSDYERVIQRRWYARALCGKNCTSWYVQGTGPGERYLHRFIMQPPAGMWVDHIDGNGLNNTRSNLRLCTPQQSGRHRPNTVNRHGFRGVHWCAIKNKWRVRIGASADKMVAVGRFRDIRNAAEAYDLAATYYFGDFAALNFPDKRDEYREKLQLLPVPHPEGPQCRIHLPDLSIKSVPPNGSQCAVQEQECPSTNVPPK